MQEPLQFLQDLLRLDVLLALGKTSWQVGEGLMDDRASARHGTRTIVVRDKSDRACVCLIDCVRLSGMLIRTLGTTRTLPVGMVFEILTNHRDVSPLGNRRLDRSR